MSKMRNIGKVSQQWLYEIEIYSLPDLQTCGAARAFSLIRSRHPQASLNLLWALEGAILEVDWRTLSEDQKAELRRQIR